MPPCAPTTGSDRRWRARPQAHIHGARIAIGTPPPTEWAAEQLAQDLSSRPEKLRMPHVLARATTVEDGRAPYRVDRGHCCEDVDACARGHAALETTQERQVNTLRRVPRRGPEPGFPNGRDRTPSDRRERQGQDPESPGRIHGRRSPHLRSVHPRALPDWPPPGASGQALLRERPMIRREWR